MTYLISGEAAEPPFRDDAGPVLADGATRQSNGSSTNSSVPASPAVAVADELVYAIRVVVNDNGGARTYLVRSLAAAERAVGRADARGREAVVTLCAITPLEVLR